MIFWLYGEPARLEIAFDSCPGTGICANLQFMQRVFGLQPGCVITWRI